MAVSVKTLETKKVEKPESSATATQSKAVQSFFSDVKAEFKKITWTEKEELKAYTKLVVGATFICGFGVYCVDLVIRGCLVTLQTIIHLIFG